MKLKIKNIIIILIGFAIIAGLLVSYAMFNDYIKEQETNRVVEQIENEQKTLSDKIQAIIDSTVVVKQEELPQNLQDKKEPDKDISGIVSDTVDDVIITDTSGFKEIKAISGDTFECLYNGKNMTFRLIGLKSNGSIEGLQRLLDNSTDLNVEYDTIKKNSDDIQLIYLWDGEQDDACENMINMQMVLNKYGTTTYLTTSDSVAETPNIKYSTTFIRYQKLVNVNN